MRLPVVSRLLLVALLVVTVAVAQSTNATVSGIVLDPSGKAIPGVDIEIVNDATGVRYPGRTNSEGIYAMPNLPPGSYRIQVSKIGFKALIKPDVILNVQSALAINFTLPVGAASETLTVEGGASLLHTESAAVSTVVDRQFAENLPLNGRSFQTLIQLSPGVVLTPSSEGTEGQFSVNGQRSAANYWMVDGVGANVGTGANFNAGNGVGGAIGSFSVLGGTNSLVSVDAMQEFRIQTSTYAPEFGRVPGAQISIVTRSGTNRFRGTAFEYLRNSVLDANSWFADEAELPKPEERQNDFGGTFSGPIVKDRTFFFFSYEGLRLRLPQTTLTSVPDLAARQNALSALQPYLRAYPQPNGPDDSSSGIAQFNASYSNPATLNAYSLRLDHKINDKLTIFGRYDYSPSGLDERGTSDLYPLSNVEPITIDTQTATAGITWSVSPFRTNDLRFNYSRTTGSSYNYIDNFGGAIPLAATPLPSPYTPTDATFVFTIFGLVNGNLAAGPNAQNTQRQINLIDSLVVQKGPHNLKFGADYRRLSPSFNPGLYEQNPIFADVPSAMAGNLLGTILYSARSSTLLLQNLGLFAQDTWRARDRLTVTYGVRWDVDYTPSSLKGPGIPAVTGYDLANLSDLALATPGTQAFATTFGNFAPRIGVAYQFSQNPNWAFVVRSGFGLFYDLATSQVGETLGSYYPFGARNVALGGAFPLPASAAAPPPITPSQLASFGAVLTAFDPHLRLPYTLEWNLAIEQALGKQQHLTASYIGSGGRRLLQTAYVSSPNSAFSNVALIGNTASSSYNALQIQFERRLSHGLQTLASYTFSHSIDDGSLGTYGTGSNTFVPGASSNSNRGPSDFDERNVFSAGLTYDVPISSTQILAKALLRDWSLESVIQAWSAPPVNVYYSEIAALFGAQTQVRPDAVEGTSLYLHGSEFPGGKALNPLAFMPPPLDTNGNPTRQGDLGRNALRGFGAAQWDFAVHHSFPVRDPFKLQFRAEMFNVLNHPNFSPPIGDLQSPQSLNPQFGLSVQTLGQYLGGANVGGGGFDSLYQVGGPRSVQLALKLIF